MWGEHFRPGEEPAEPQWEGTGEREGVEETVPEEAREAGGARSCLVSSAR